MLATKARGPPKLPTSWGSMQLCQFMHLGASKALLRQIRRNVFAVGERRPWGGRCRLEISSNVLLEHDRRFPLTGKQGFTSAWAV